MHYVRQVHRPGQLIKLGDVRGRIRGFTQTAVIVEIGDGEAHVPGRMFQRPGGPKCRPRRDDVETDRVLSEAFVAQHPAEAARAMEGHSVGEVCGVFCPKSVPGACCARGGGHGSTLAAAALGEVERRRRGPGRRGAARRRRRPPAAAPSTEGARRDRRADDPRATGAAWSRRCATRPAAPARCSTRPFLTVAPDLTVETALARVRGADSGVHYYLFVVDRHGMLAGVVSLHELLAARPTPWSARLHGGRSPRWRRRRTALRSSRTPRGRSCTRCRSLTPPAGSWGSCGPRRCAGSSPRSRQRRSGRRRQPGRSISASWPGRWAPP